jgi:hypothetical protein
VTRADDGFVSVANVVEIMEKAPLYSLSDFDMLGEAKRRVGDAVKDLMFAESKAKDSAHKALTSSSHGRPAAERRAARMEKRQREDEDELLWAKDDLRKVEESIRLQHLATLGVPGDMINGCDDFKCPITLELMEDPVVASDGHSYERSAIEKHYFRRSAQSPMTREILTSVFIPNLNLKKRIRAYNTELTECAMAVAMHQLDYVANEVRKISSHHPPSAAEKAEQSKESNASNEEFIFDEYGMAGF